MICKHSKGYWTKELTELRKKFKKCKRNFEKRSDPSNQMKLNQCREQFVQAVEKSRQMYLKNLSKELDPKNPNKFWSLINKTRNNYNKPVIQPILRNDNSLAVDDEDIYKEMKILYGQEKLAVKDHLPEWYEKVKQDVVQIEETERQKLTQTPTEVEESDITIKEVEEVIKGMNKLSAPSPEEQILGTMITKGGEQMCMGLQFLFQRCWEQGQLPDGFKLDPKVMLPKPNKPTMKPNHIDLLP